ncbi:MAG: hypothetical protein HOE90_07535 [Bacteriovoracaceae bacterium]|jgi:hypothetical protein|nr:hypothetical protein [Bacteriovoracaceae bacterium]
MKWPTLLVVLSLSFLLIGKYWGSSQSEISEGPDCSSDTQFLEKMEELKNQKLNEYLELNNPAQKLEKANEILGQIFILLLAQFSFKLTERQEDWATESEDQKFPQSSFCPKMLVEKPQEKIPAQAAVRPDENELRSFSGIYDRTIKKSDMEVVHRSGFFEKKSTSWTQFSKSFRSKHKYYFPSDIYNGLWKNGLYLDALNNMNKRLLAPYLGEFVGIYRSVDFGQSPVEAVIQVKKEDGPEEVVEELAVAIQSYQGKNLKNQASLFFNRVLSPGHPKGHATHGQGSCRGFVLRQSDKSHNGIHFIKYRELGVIIGRVFSDLSTAKDHLVGTFLLWPKNKPAPHFPIDPARSRGSL